MRLVEFINQLAKCLFVRFKFLFFSRALIIINNPGVPFFLIFFSKPKIISRHQKHTGIA